MNLQGITVFINYQFNKCPKDATYLFVSNNLCSTKQSNKLLDNLFICCKKQCKTVYLKIFGPFSKQCPIKVSVP